MLRGRVLAHGPGPEVREMHTRHGARAAALLTALPALRNTLFTSDPVGQSEAVNAEAKTPGRIGTSAVGPGGPAGPS